MDKKYIDKFIDTTYFSYPKKFLESLICSFKIRYQRQQLELLNPCLVVCTKSCEFDEYLIRRTISTDYVVLKDWVVKAIYTNTLSNEDKTAVLNKIKDFKMAMISVVMFPDYQISILGKNNELPMAVTEFMFETGLNLKFINFSNAYFSKPIWSKNFRHVQTFFNSKFSITNSHLSTMTKDERFEKINRSMPSSASVYGHKHHLQIKDSNLAKGLENIVFACPSCKTYFTLKSEYNHLKCSNCLEAFECTPQGDIYANGKTFSFDDIERILRKILNEKTFDKNESIIYNPVCFSVIILDTPVHVIKNLKLEVFSNKLKFSGISFEKIINFKEIILIEYLPENRLKLTLKSNEVFDVKLEENDNAYFIYSLIKQKTQL